MPRSQKITPAQQAAYRASQQKQADDLKKRKAAAKGKNDPNKAVVSGSRREKSYLKNSKAQ